MPQTTTSSTFPAEATLDGQKVDIEHELTKGFAARLIAKKAKQLVRQFGFKKSDREDLMQEMRLRVWKGFQKFDATKAHWNAFVTTIIERQVATIIEATCRLKRNEGEYPDSLDVLLAQCQEDDAEESDDGLTPRETERFTGRDLETDQKLSVLKLDVDDVIASLPDDLRELCEHLKFYDITETAEQMGVPRTTVHSRLARLKEVFAKNGFEDFSGIRRRAEEKRGR